jgi:hypothetical protein
VKNEIQMIIYLKKKQKRVKLNKFIILTSLSCS